MKQLLKKTHLTKALRYLCLLILSFLLGRCIGMIHQHFFPSGKTETTTSLSALNYEYVTATCRPELNSSVPIIAPAAEGNWGLSFQEDGKPPIANATAAELKKYDAYYAGSQKKKVLYLAFDAGYENGNTEPILDALKKHNVPATFFVVGPFISEHPELIKRMAQEGHTVGNHTYSHPDMSKISTKESFQKELGQVEELYEEITGTPMTKYYRPPQGKYSESNLSMAKELGYKTFFWSLAYVDWYQDDQPSKEEAFDKLLGRIHPGAIVLLHSTSSTNGEILDELLTKWEEMGYTFQPLKNLAKQKKSK